MYILHKRISLTTNKKGEIYTAGCVAVTEGIESPVSPQKEGDGVGVQLQPCDGGGHWVALQLGLMNQALNLRPIDLVGQGTSHNQQSLVHLRVRTRLHQSHLHNIWKVYTGEYWPVYRKSSQNMSKSERKITKNKHPFWWRGFLNCT